MVRGNIFILAINMTCTISFAVSQRIAHIQNLLGQLVTKSDELTCKVDDVSKLVEDFKCAFQSLDGDVEALESIKSLGLWILAVCF